VKYIVCNFEVVIVMCYFNLNETQSNSFIRLETSLKQQLIILYYFILSLLLQELYIGITYKSLPNL
jgi:hypothetical protein